MCTSTIPRINGHEDVSWCTSGVPVILGALVCVYPEFTCVPPHLWDCLTDKVPLDHLHARPNPHLEDGWYW